VPPKQGQESATPFLDLLQPLPKPYDRRVTGYFAMPFLTIVGLIVLTQNYHFLVVPFSFALVGFLTTLVHELGHLLGGWSVGMRFDGIVVGPFALKRHPRGWTFRLTPRLARGLTWMSFPEISRIRNRLLYFGAGGPLASVFCGVGALIGGELARARYDSPWPALAEFLGLYSLFIGIISFLPYRAGPYAGDGLLLRALLKSKERSKQLVAGYALGVLSHKNPDGCAWNRRWARTAYSDSPLYTGYHADWYAYWTASDPGAAAAFLERCLAGSAYLEPEERDQLVAEAVKFSAWDQNNVGKARRWFAFVQRPERLNELTRVRMDAALAFAGGNLDQCLTRWHRGLKLIEESPPGIAAREYEATWRAWRIEMEQRLSREPHPAEHLDIPREVPSWQGVQ